MSAPEVTPVSVATFCCSFSSFYARAEQIAGDPGEQDESSIVIMAPSTSVVINTLHPGESPGEVKLSTWGGAKELLGKKIYCH